MALATLNIAIAGTRPVANAGCVVADVVGSAGDVAYMPPAAAVAHATKYVVDVQPAKRRRCEPKTDAGTTCMPSP